MHTDVVYMSDSYNWVVELRMANKFRTEIRLSEDKIKSKAIYVQQNS